jgi:hypothetical protein
MKAKKIAFVTKDGKEVSFKKKPGAAGQKKSKAATFKVLEKRLSTMEKAILSYNKSAAKHNENRAKEKKEKKEKVSKKPIVVVDSDSD